jgi:CDP-diacylglycerol--serine O-phosphatidyltransferase
MLNDLQREGLRALVLAFVVASVAGSLMISRFPYLSGKDFNLNRRVPFALLVLIPLAFILVGSSPPEMLFGLFGLYALSGPMLWAWHRIARGRRGAAQASAGKRK